MHENSIVLHEFPEHDSISVCVLNDDDDLFALGERINARFPQAYMNGYNWDALIRYYVASVDPKLMNEVETDPEAGMYSAYLSHSPDNLAKMQRFISHIHDLVDNEAALMAFIDKHVDQIDWE
jgi:hypothetical protein